MSQGDGEIWIMNALKLAHSKDTVAGKKNEKLRSKSNLQSNIPYCLLTDKIYDGSFFAMD